MEIDRICDVDNDLEDPQLCATLASDVYMHLREAEVTHSFRCLRAEMVPLKLWTYGIAFFNKDHYAYSHFG